MHRKHRAAATSRSALLQSSVDLLCTHLRARAPRLIPLSLLVAVLWGCGGGGSSSSAAPRVPTPPNTSSPPPTAQPTPTSPAQINESNAFVVAVAGVSAPESLIQLLLFGLQHAVGAIDALPSETTAQRNCGLGTIDATIEDNDADLQASAGDSILIEINGTCSAFELSADVQNDRGVIRLTFTEAIVERNGDYLLAGRFATVEQLAINPISGTRLDSEISADFAFRAIRQAEEDQETLFVTAEGNDALDVRTFDATRDDREISTAFTVERQMTPTSDEPVYSLTFEFDQQNSSAGGAISCSSLGTLTGVRRVAPGAGEYRCTGAGGSAVAVRGEELGSITQPVVSLDSSGDGTFVPFESTEGRSARWENYLDGQLFELLSRAASRRFGEAPLPSITSATADASVEDILFDSANNRLYLSNASGIVVLTPDTLAVESTINVPGTPTSLALSDDASTLWMGFSDRS